MMVHIALNGRCVKFALVTLAATDVAVDDTAGRLSASASRHFFLKADVPLTAISGRLSRSNMEHQPSPVQLRANPEKLVAKQLPTRSIGITLVASLSRQGADPRKTPLVGGTRGGIGIRVAYNISLLSKVSGLRCGSLPLRHWISKAFHPCHPGFFGAGAATASKALGSRSALRAGEPGIPLNRQFSEMAL
jgi:hypothetical protein